MTSSAWRCGWLALLCGLATPSLLAQAPLGCPFPPIEEVEPNNSADQATPQVVFGSLGELSAMGGRIFPAGDVDWFRLDLTSPGSTSKRLWLLLDTGVPQPPGGSSRDVVAEVYDGDLLIGGDDDDGTGNGRDFSIETGLAAAVAGLPLNGPGPFYLRVSAKNPGDVIARYSVLVSFSTQGDVAESEPNDTTAQAQSLFLAGVVAGTLPPGDVDVYDINTFGVLLVAASGNPPGTTDTTDLRLELLTFDGSLAMLVDSSRVSLSPAPLDEAFGIESLSARYVRVSRAVSTPGDGRYVIALRTSFECPAPVSLERFAVE
jgi:hypothetical protein